MSAVASWTLGEAGPGPPPPHPHSPVASTTTAAIPLSFFTIPAPFPLAIRRFYLVVLFLVFARRRYDLCSWLAGGVPDDFRDLMPLLWSEVESKLKQGQTVLQRGKARNMNVLLVATPTRTKLVQELRRFANDPKNFAELQR
jgi:hypothetical protein